MFKDSVLVISDTQAPFHHKKTISFLKKLKKKYKPNKVIHIGDLVDAYCLSAYLCNPDALSKVDELDKTRKFIKELGKVFPEMVVIRGNHDRRLQNAAKNAGMPSQVIKTWKEILEAPDGWEWKDEYLRKGVLYQHGDEKGAGGGLAAMNRAKINGINTVAGHLHTNASIMYFANRSTLLWGMHVGALIDDKAIGFEYGKKNLKKSVISTGLVLDGNPVLIPMEL